MKNLTVKEIENISIKGIDVVKFHEIRTQWAQAHKESYKKNRIRTNKSNKTQK